MKRLAALALVLGASFTLGLAAQNAGTADTQYFSDLHWRLVGPHRPGRLWAVAGVPDDPTTYYAGTPAGALWKTTNGGITWASTSDSLPVTGIGAVAVAPSNDNVRLVALGNFQIWGTAAGSSTLTNMTGAGMPSHRIGRIQIDPTNPAVAYVGYSGFNLGAGNHVWKTTNLTSGTPTWAASGTGLPDVPVNAMVIDPVVSTRLWVGTDVGVYRSEDGGASWFPYTTGMPVAAVFDMDMQASQRILRVGGVDGGGDLLAADAFDGGELFALGLQGQNGA